MVHSSLIACIKMGVSIQIPNNTQLYHCLDTLTKILQMLVPMGNTAPAAAVVLPRYGGMNYACGINED